MPLFSASEDFTRYTLSAIPELLSRLAYITSLRDKEGTYCHWGLVRTHGSAAATEAMGHAHLEVLTKVLRTPLSQLMREVEDTSKSGSGRQRFCSRNRLLCDRLCRLGRTPPRSAMPRLRFSRCARWKTRETGCKPVIESHSNPHHLS